MKTREKTNKKSADIREVYICPGCNKIYQDPPKEDWSECEQYANWWHKSCTTYVFGQFIVTTQPTKIQNNLMFCDAL